jgi:hypothetical protein
VLPILVIGLIFLGCGVFLAHRMSKRDDGQMFAPRDRLIITLAIFALLGAAGKTLLGGGAAAAAFGLVIVIPAGVILAFIWLPAAVEGLLSGLTGAMTGGNQQIEAKPVFYRALAQRRKGRFSEALVEIDTELLKFPGNLEGLLLKAEIQADDLKTCRPRWVCWKRLSKPRIASGTNGWSHNSACPNCCCTGSMTSPRAGRSWSRSSKRIPRPRRPIPHGNIWRTCPAPMPTL